MADAVKQEKVEDVKKVEHKNIFAALSAFQGENIKIERTKKVSVKSKKGEDASYDFWYSPLDEMIMKVRPALAKHGLSFVHREFGEATGAGNRPMVCELYHETYERKGAGTIKKSVSKTGDAQDLVETEEPVFMEINLIRSMPIVVKRSGDMKDVGSESTYARRYTLGEVLGIASEEDNDVKDMEERAAKLEGQVMRQARAGILAADAKKLDENETFIKKELAALGDGKKTALGLTAEQYAELQQEIEKRRAALGKGKGAPGENAEGTVE